VKKEGEVEQQLNSQEQLLGELHSVISSLGDRISPVLREVGPEKDSASVPREGLVPVANKIREGNEAIGNAIERLQSLRRRVEL